MIMPVVEVLASNHRSSNNKCYICGQAGAAFHYGCKAFFRRAIRMSRDYQCPTLGGCHIDQERRIFCRKCRIDKCLQVGMKPEDVQPKREVIKKSVPLVLADGFQQILELSTLQKGHYPSVEQRRSTNCSPDWSRFEFSESNSTVHTNVEETLGYPVGPRNSVKHVLEHIPDAPLAFSGRQITSIDRHVPSIDRQVPRIAPSHVPSVKLSPVASISMVSYLIQDQVSAAQDDTAFADIDVGAFDGDYLFINCSDDSSVSGPSPFLSPPVSAPGLDLAVMPPSAFTAFTGDLSETAPAGGYNVGWVIERLLVMDQIIDAHLSKAVSRALAEMPITCEADLVSMLQINRLSHFELKARILAMREFGMFRMLPQEDQVALLRNGCFEAKMLCDLQRSENTDGFIVLVDGLHKAVPLSPDSPLVRSGVVFDVLLTRFQELKTDAIEICCLKAILFWDADVCSPESKSFVRERQTMFMAALEDYVLLKANYTPGRAGVLLWFIRTFKNIASTARKGLKFLVSSEQFGIFQRDSLKEDLLDNSSSNKTGAIADLLQNYSDAD